MNDDIWEDMDSANVQDDQERAIDLPANLPDAFWEARPILKEIRSAARATLDAPDAVLGVVLAKTSAMAHHDLKFDFLGGKPGSLNVFVALCAASGVGKSSAEELASRIVCRPRYLTDESFRDGIGLGTGEGMAEAFMGMVEVDTGEFHERSTKSANRGDPKVKVVKGQIRHNAFFYLDEGQTLSKMMKDRKGTTIAETIRSAWMGQALGQQNAQELTTRFVPRGSYSMGIVVGFQPDTAQDLLGDGGTGTPQRFLWLSAYDPDVPDEIDDEIPEIPQIRLPIETGTGTPVTGVITCPAWIRQQLRRERLDVRAGRKIVSELDSHVSLMLCKLSSLLALLDGRMVADDTDWELAGMVWDTSCQVRDYMIRHGQVKAAAEKEQRLADVVEVAERTQIAKITVDGAVVRLARKLGRQVWEDGSTTIGDFRRKQQSSDRRACDPAAEYASQQGWIVREGDRMIMVGTIRP